jgi:hypothetical protein
MSGPLAYRDQPIEAEANNAGKLAEYHAHKTYAREPEPLVSVRTKSAQNNVAQGYEDLVDEWRYGKPPMGGPVLRPRGGAGKTPPPGPGF